MDDLAIIIVSTNEAHWLRPCLRTVFDRMGDIGADVVVVDNDSRDDTAALVEREFPEARVVWSANHGFSHANNRALMTCDARYVLLLNPDTEIVSGTFEELVMAMDERPVVGLAGVRQVNGEGELCPTIRRFPNGLRALGEALAAERVLGRPGWLGEAERDLDVYDREIPCDWTTGSFMLVRREAIQSAGFLDERFFMYSDETDWCRRIKAAGWEVRHLPLMTIIHHYDKDGMKPSVESLAAYNRVVYARKHFSPGHWLLFKGAVLLRHVLRTVVPGSRERREANRVALLTLLGKEPVPYGPPSRFSVRGEREAA